MKHEWRKAEKLIYGVKQPPQWIDIEPMTYIQLEGKGDPNHPHFAEEVEALYAVSYAIRMMPKKQIVPEGYFEYTVYPLEGLWDLDEEGRKLSKLDKSHLVYHLMIRQPQFVTEQVFERARTLSAGKINSELLNKLQLVTITDGPSVQCLHVGSYDDEPETFARMEAYCEANQLVRMSKAHREIYLSDARKVEPSKRQTILRFSVSSAI
ncbi:hypothetical protein PCCS19_01980 [Paenibacillus sp. CCS19]|uniref:GyrI-like domain-containing protein n=1 Tax=Paenibacillus sp. CCS19 TaxID=3158387 RepID=UPI002562B322|nr:GyrI-like domain-containing protein [Paenibacillus cellulosilyticus]GMK37145.1 hypothetical protein PCCS19_01980 [Paenibacillus cellulosilyticus]